MNQGFQTIEIMMLRNVITFAVVLLTFIVMYFNKKITVHSVKSILYMLCVGLICFHVSSFFDLYSLNYISVNLERLIVHLYPSIVCILLVVKNGRQAVNVNQWISILIIYVATILFVGFETNSLFSWIGVLFAFLAALFYALYFVLIDSSIKKYGGTQATLFSLPLASLTINAQFWISDGQLDFDLFTTNNLLLLFVLGAVIGVGSMWLINQAMQRLGPSNTAIISSLGPFITAVIAYAFLGETLTMIQLLAMSIVVLALYQLSRGKTK